MLPFPRNCLAVGSFSSEDGSKKRAKSSSCYLTVKERQCASKKLVFVK